MLPASFGMSFALLFARDGIKEMQGKVRIGSMMLAFVLPLPCRVSCLASHLFISRREVAN